MKFSPDSKFFQFCLKLVELTKLNLLWLLCSLPIVTAGAATTAMLSCLYARRGGEECGAKAFFRAFRAHFGKATILWVVTLFLGIMLALDYALLAYMDFPGRMAAIALIFFVGFLLILVSGILYPLLIQFPGTLKDTVVNAVLLSIANLPKLLMVTAMNILPLLLFLLLPQVFLLTGFFWILGGVPLMGIYDIYTLEKIFVPLRERASAG